MRRDRQFLLPAMRLQGLATILLLFVACSTPATAATPAAGGSGEGQREEHPVIMSEAVYKRLSTIHELLGRQDIAEALERLASLERQRLSPYETALVMQAYGYAYIGQDRNDLAVEYFEKTLALDALPGLAQQGMLYSLAGLYASMQRHADALRVLSEWFEHQADPVPDAHVLMASCYYELGRFEEALVSVTEANETQRRLGVPPVESWYQLQLAILFELGKLKQAAVLLRQMIALWPDRPEYWKNISAMYSRLEMDEEALAFLNLAHASGRLTREDDLLFLVRLHLFLDQPFQGGVLLESELAAGRVGRDQNNLELLLQAWEAAREYPRAVAVLEQLANMEGTGRFVLDKAQLLARQAAWPEAAEAVRLAIDRGGLADPAEAWLLLGMALAEDQRYEEAGQALRKARNDGSEEQSRRALGWLEYIKERRELRAGLKE